MARTRTISAAALVAALAAAALTVERGLAEDPEASLARLSPDRGFRGNGRTLARLGFDVVDHVRIDSAGRIVVAGAKRTLGEIETGIDVYAPLVARLLPDGRVDRTFGQGGVTQIAALGRATGLVLGPSFQGQDQIVVVGDFVDVYLRRFAATRLYADGAPDNRFETGAMFASVPETVRTWRFPSLDPSTGALTVVAGDTAPARIVRLTDTGALDDTFGTGGVVVEDEFVVVSMAVDADGRAVVARLAASASHPWEPPVPQTADVVRLDSAGSPDPAFGGDGRLHGPGGGVIAARTLRFDAAGRLVVRGREPDGLSGFFRFLGDGAPDASFSDDGFAPELNGIPGGSERSDGPFAVAADAGGAYVSAGDLTYWLSQPIAGGYVVQSVDPANPTAVRSLVVRDPRPYRKARPVITTEAVSADGSSVVVAGYTILTAEGHERSVPEIFRVDLSRSAPVPLPDVRIATIAAAADASNGSFRFRLTLDVANDGAGAWVNGYVFAYLSDDDVLDPADKSLGTWSTGPVRAGRTVEVRRESGWFSFSDVPSLSGKRILVAINPSGTGMEAGGANAVVAAPAFE